MIRIDDIRLKSSFSGGCLKPFCILRYPSHNSSAPSGIQAPRRAAARCHTAPFMIRSVSESMPAPPAA